MSSSKIIIYGAEWCGFCHAARRYLDDKGIEYDYRDVEQDMDDMRAAIEKSGQTGIPVIDIDGTIIIGFDRPRIDQVLKDKQIVK
ncbi:glutaredoxin family protein [Candidatus Saccharibacteria bacterium]|nr:glutaredoxin family protein [Candidatus Saccharibacteria bacterium]